MTIEIYRDFLIDFDPPPISSRHSDWVATHKDYDGPEDGRCFRAASLKDLYIEIDTYLDCSAPEDIDPDRLREDRDERRSLERSGFYGASYND